MPRGRILRVFRRIGLALSATALLPCCSQPDGNNVFTVGGSYRLTLNLSTPVNAKRAAYFSPMVDSAIRILHVDSASADCGYATFSGEHRHFPVGFGDLGDLHDSSVVIVENHGRFRAGLSSAKATDTGIWLIGTREHDTVSGTWQELGWGLASGHFSMRPGA